MRIFYATLTDALDDIARRSFYEDAKVTPVVMVDDPAAIVGYVVDDDHGHNLTDEWTWTYEHGIADRDSASETSRLFDPAEFWDNAEHVRYSMTESVDALERGVPVTFAYAVVNDAGVDHDEHGNPIDAETGELMGDDIAGWIVAAIIWED